LTSTHRARYVEILYQYFDIYLFIFSIQRFLNELEKSLNTTARKEPLNTTHYLACQRILTEFVKIFDTQGYEKVNRTFLMNIH
jgi:predicted nucleic acid-binding protein